MKLPALRDRREDIPYLTAACVRETSERLQKPVLGLTPGAERRLSAAMWEENIRELRNVLERACILVDGDFITEREVGPSMPDVVRPPLAAAAASPQQAARQTASPDGELLIAVERDHIQRALARAGGNKKAAAKMLGLKAGGRSTAPGAPRAVRLDYTT